MGGGKKKKLQEEAEAQSRAARERETAQAETLRQELGRRQELVSRGVPEVQESFRQKAEQFASGGFTPPQENLDSRGYGGYKELATTGGFTPESMERIRSKATAPIASMYGAAKDELSRSRALQGGYSPGFTASQDRITRRAAQGGAEAALNAEVGIEEQVRQGKQAGLAGMERTRAAAGSEALAGVDALQKYYTFGVDSLSNIDVTGLRNILQSGQMTQADAQLLTALSAQHKSLFDKVMQGISVVGGAAAGVMGALPAGGG